MAYFKIRKKKKGEINLVRSKLTQVQSIVFSLKRERIDWLESVDMFDYSSLERERLYNVDGERDYII